ncbi:pentapeptide repeat-containing protein [Pleionea sp. CnH1-48]|uniref:pentapeptide repeat-containing protein n=1 Tax=Pleionea sp. CnH1-48 TaxID=2954494 RepID=UPI00209842ED|nr:pentapeptide repeat-containing protein [Pleionea sp. CnH1-48]MCO7222892.1 pentapeptide repeat-containing protein [Pleionea sp. CnH1-48]
MEQSDLIKLIDQGCDVWNNWRSSHPQESIDLSDVSFAHKNLAGFDFSECQLERANFSEANLAGSSFISANLKHVNFSFANLENANFIAAEMFEANLTSARVTKANFLTAQSRGADFSRVDFEGHDLQSMDLRHVRLCGASLSYQKLDGMDFTGSDFTGAIMKEVSLQNANLQSAVLSHVNLHGALLNGANMKGVELSESDLSRLSFSKVNLSEASLLNCDLRYCNLSQSNLTKADLSGCKLFDIKTIGWNIKSLRCTHAYWDESGQTLTRYRRGEFERLYSDSISIELRYDNYIAAHEFATLPIMVEHLEAKHWGTRLRVKSIEDVAGYTSVKILLEETGGNNVEQLEADLKEEASNLLVAQLMMRDDHHLLREFKESLASIKNKFWPRLLELAAENESNQIRMFTVIIMDLKDFSRWKGEERNEKLNLFRGLIKPILKRWKANYPNMEGDSLRACFQNASVGVACACMIRNVLSAAGFACRIGLDIGEVTLQHNEVTEQMDLSGEAVNFAARLESCCDDDSVLISDRVWHYIRSHQEYFAYHPMTVKLEKGVGDLKAGQEVSCYYVNMIKPLI